MAQQKILITSALPYVNNIPHLGNIIGCVLPADVIARFYRRQEYKVLYVCGADEYGTATEVKAREEGLTPRELCDKYYAKHKEIYDWFNIKFDVFGRTSTPNPRTDDHFHTRISQRIFNKLHENGYLEKRDVSQLYCPTINRFVADRFVIGTCPKCGDDRARGDQCDKCQAVYESIELVQPHLKGNDNASLELRTSQHLFLRLDLLQPQIEEWFAKTKRNWATNAISVTEAWLKKGLQPRCITRDMEWGTPLSVNIEGMENKVMYNWFDAPVGYISITGEDKFAEWWQDPNVKLIQFMGIDNVPFHTILFPGSLLGSKTNITLVSDVASVHYLNFEGGKFSKTEGRGIFGDEVMKKGIHPDYWRYYLMKIRAEDGIGSAGNHRGDANFTFDDFHATCNADLCNNVGNLVHRLFSLIHKFCGGKMKYARNSDNRMEQLQKCAEHDSFQAYHSNLIGSAIKCALELSTQINKYLTDWQPWVLYVSGEEEDGNKVLCNAFLALCTVLDILEPVMPVTIDRILSFIEVNSKFFLIKSGFTPFFQPI